MNENILIMGGMTDWWIKTYGQWEEWLTDERKHMDNERNDWLVNENIWTMRGMTNWWMKTYGQWEEWLTGEWKHMDNEMNDWWRKIYCDWGGWLVIENI